jgi:hypothetical protein
VSVTRRAGIGAALGYAATIFAANWLVQHVGIVSVGFGLAWLAINGRYDPEAWVWRVEFERAA